VREQLSKTSEMSRRYRCLEEDAHVIIFEG